MKSQSFWQSLKYAWRGIGEAVRTERNFRIHLSMAGLVLWAALLVKLDAIKLAMLFFTISLVLVCELINTALERVVDLCSGEYHPLARVAKDVAAGAVLLASINAVIMGILIFGGSLWQLFKNF